MGEAGDLYSEIAFKNMDLFLSFLAETPVVS